MSKAVEKAYAKFERIKRIDCTTPDGRKALKAMSDTWTKRKSKSTGDLYRRRNAKPGKVTVI